MTEKAYYHANPLMMPSSEKIKDYSTGVVAVIVIGFHLLFLWTSHLSLTPPLPASKQKVVVQTVHLNAVNVSKKAAAVKPQTLSPLSTTETSILAASKEPIIPKNDLPASPPLPKEDLTPKKAEAVSMSSTTQLTPAAPSKPTNKPPASKIPPSNKAIAAAPTANKEKEQKKPVPAKKSADLKIAQAPKEVEKNRIKKELEQEGDEKNRIKKELEEQRDYEKNRIKKELEQRDYEKMREKEALEKKDAERKREKEALERKAEEKRRQAKIEAEALERRRREDKEKAARRLAFAQVENSLAKNQESRSQMMTTPAINLPDANLPTLIDKLHIDALPVDTEGMAQWTVKEMDYRNEVAQILQRSLSLPEYGSVKIELLVHKSGKVEKIKVLSSESGKNKQYIETKVPALYFPSFGMRFPGKEQSTFVIILNNEYKI